MKAENRLSWIYLQQAIRDFFTQRGFLDVLTPPIVQNPGMETHLHPFQLKSAYQRKDYNLYLHTSPEFHMKQLLSEGLEKIFTLSYSFRDEPKSDHHRHQFIMLEWYRSQERYEKIMEDTLELFTFCCQFLKDKNIPIKESLLNLTPVKMTIQELLQEVIGINILDFLDKKNLENLIRRDFSDVPLPTQGEELTWDDLYFLLFLNKVEPELKKYPFILLYEFPHHLSALSTLKESDPRVCERFEVYSHGIELCNCFNELTDLEIQKKRFNSQAEEKKKLYSYSLPKAEVLYNALDKGLPQSAGIALGVERLLMTITEQSNPFWD